MKKIFLLAALFVSSLLIAQDNNSSPFGVYAGLSYSGMKGNDSRIPGVQFGFGYDINESITVGGGLTHRGGKFNRDNEFMENMGAVELDGFAVETWVTYSLVSSSVASLWLGPSYSYIFTLEGSGGAETTDNDYGILVGGSLFLSEKRSINIGYYNGMTKNNYNNFFLEYGIKF
tara:strand:+ start:1101 stop:1622 length:522 start_codon:yes stop_codon:yes gene_type:complete